MSATNGKTKATEIGSPRDDLIKRRKLSEALEKRVDDTNISFIQPLLPPACLIDEKPLDTEVVDFVSAQRSAIAQCVRREDDRVIVVVGPCSIHDPEACLEYAKKLAPVAKKVANEVVVIMRTYFEKPRTTVGWKGLINDPELNNSFSINSGLKKARDFLINVNKLGLPTAVEFLDVISPQWLADCVSWGAIGARTTESQLHRELASGLSCPVGFKNGTSGDFKVGVDACGSAKNPHSFLSVTKQGLAAIVHTKGNAACHLILRGGSNTGPNFEEEHVKKACEVMEKSGLEPRVMIDCSHANSSKDHKKQPVVCESVCKQIATNPAIVGLMIESHLNEGKQKLDPGVTDLKTLKYGVSVTDACIDFATTEKLLDDIAAAVKARRANK